MTDLAKMIEEAVERDGLEELVVRVTRYDADLETPAAWQAIAKYRGRVKGPWGVGIRTRPAIAIVRALEDGARRETPQEDIFG